MNTISLSLLTLKLRHLKQLIEAKTKLYPNTGEIFAGNRSRLPVSSIKSYKDSMPYVRG